MLRLALTPRWLSFTVFTLALIVAFGFLSHWQWHRHRQRDAYNIVIDRNVNQTPVTPDELMKPGQDLPKSQLWRSVALTGRYDAKHVLVVRKRSFDEDNPGFNVLTPIVGANHVALWVNRGFVASAASASSQPDLPPVPAGTVTVVARMRLSEHSPDFAPADLPTGQINSIDVAGMSRTLPYKAYGGYGEVVSELPQTEPAPTPLPPPKITSGPYLSYAAQWVLFCFIAVLGWYTFLRKEAERLEEERAREAAAAGGPDPDGPGDEDSVVDADSADTNQVRGTA